LYRASGWHFAGFWNDKKDAEMWSNGSGRYLDSRYIFRLPAENEQVAPQPVTREQAMMAACAFHYSTEGLATHSRSSLVDDNKVWRAHRNDIPTRDEYASTVALARDTLDAWHKQGGGR